MTDEQLALKLKELRRSFLISQQSEEINVAHYIHQNDISILLYLIHQEERRLNATINARKSAIFNERMRQKQLRHCSQCKHCRPSEEAIHRGCFVCTEKKSDYYRAFLNIDLDGAIQPTIIGEGCSQWESIGGKNDKSN